jgi:hypothetical protein
MFERVGGADRLGILCPKADCLVGFHLFRRHVDLGVRDYASPL